MSTIDFEALYHQYKPFLIKICRRYMDYYELDDLLQTAYIGLHKAALHFREEYGVTFIAYLGTCVKSTLLRELIGRNDIIRVPDYMRSKINFYRKVQKKLYHELMRDPLPHEIAAEMGIDVSELKEIEKTVVLQSVLCLDAPVGDDTVTLADAIKDDSADMGVAAEVKDLRLKLWQVVRLGLDGDLFDLIYEYFHENITLIAYAKRYNTTKMPFTGICAGH